MDSVGTLCLLGIIVIAALFLLPRLMGAGARNIRRERPTYNDPDIGSRGSFGAPETPRYDAPEIRSRSGFGRRFPVFRRTGRTSRQGADQQPGSRVDSPEIRSRGSFGRKRD